MCLCFSAWIKTCLFPSSSSPFIGLPSHHLASWVHQLSPKEVVCQEGERQRLCGIHGWVDGTRVKWWVVDPFGTCYQQDRLELCFETCSSYQSCHNPLFLIPILSPSFVPHTNLVTAPHSLYQSCYNPWCLWAWVRVQVGTLLLGTIYVQLSWID